MRQFRHLDAFSGIGTWGLASKEVWPDRIMEGFCEIDQYCREVLAKHFPDVKVYEDVKTLSLKSLADSFGHGLQEQGTELETGRDRQLHQTYELDLFTASPPCQAASSAGKRKGTSDDRWLWPETFRILSETRPRWFVFENVRGLLSLSGGLEFDALISQMESHNYEVWPVVIPASGVGAPHRRERVWFIGRRITDPIDKGLERKEEDTHGRGEPFGERNQFRVGLEPGRRENDSNTEGGRERTIAEGDRGRKPETPAGNGSSPCLAARSEWSRDWREVARELCWENETQPGVYGMAHGTPQRVYGPRKLSEAQHRKERLKACGNGIVGQVAVEIMKAIKHADSLRSK